jgi:hypothetical protein
MRTPFRWRLLCACFAFWSMPAASQDTVQIGSVSFDRRAIALLLLVCLAGWIAGLASKSPRAPRIRLLTRPKKTRLPVLIPPGAPPRLIPGDSPNATRARRARAPVPRQAPTGTGTGIIDYIAPFADSGDSSDNARVDYLLDAGDGSDSPDRSSTD